MPGKGGHARRRVSPRELPVFLVHLAAYLEAGLPLLTALQDYRDPDRPAMTATAEALAKRLSAGEPLSLAMASHPALFQPLHIAMVRAGEGTGRLDRALRALIRLVEWNENLRTRIRAAATYPLVLLALLLLVVLLAMVYSLPAIFKLLEDLGLPLPPITRILVLGGGALASYGWLIALLLALGAGGLRLALRNPAFRLRWDRAVLALPGLGRLLAQAALARYIHVLGGQIQAGVPMVKALEASEGVAGNRWMDRTFARMRREVEQGRKLADAAADTRLFPPLVVRMVALGGEAGAMEEALDRAATHLDRELEASVGTVFALVDPALKIFMGVGLVFVAAAILLPLYQLVAGLNHG